MPNDPFFILIVLSVLAVVVVLAIGIGGFGKSGENQQKNSNKWMRYRLIAQFVAVVLIASYVYLKP